MQVKIQTLTLAEALISEDFIPEDAAKPFACVPAPFLRRHEPKT